MGPPSSLLVSISVRCTNNNFGNFITAILSNITHTPSLTLHSTPEFTRQLIFHCIAGHILWSEIGVSHSILLINVTENENDTGAWIRNAERSRGPDLTQKWTAMLSDRFSSAGTATINCCLLLET